jgi:hypothetical protein
MTQMSDEYPFHWPQERIAHYTAYRVTTPPIIDGRPNEPCWNAAPRSPRFVDLVSGTPAIHDTRAALLWDERNLYVAYWVEEPLVCATLTARDAHIWEDNDVELFIAGRDAYYELEINAFGTVFEALYIWEEAYAQYAARPEFDRDAPGSVPFNGVGFTTHPRGLRLGFWAWDFPGLDWAVYIDGTLNDDSDHDRGWTVEIALPWAGMDLLAQADGRSLPPRDGDIWRMDFSRFNTYRAAPPAKDSGGWAWSAHGIWDSHVPEVWPFIHFSTTPVEKASR